MTLKDFLEKRGMSLLTLSHETRIAYGTLFALLHRDDEKPEEDENPRQLSVRTAKKLEEYSGGELNAAELLGLNPPRKRRRTGTDG